MASGKARDDRRRSEHPNLLRGKRGLVIGIANDQSIAWGCAKAFHALGAEVAVTLSQRQRRCLMSSRWPARSTRRCFCRWTC